MRIISSPPTSGGQARTSSPENTALYQLIQNHVETFFAQVEAQTEHSLPCNIKAEFDVFLECGILANGFLRLRCGSCHHEKWWSSRVNWRFHGGELKFKLDFRLCIGLVVDCRFANE
jgi:hypothetical protein